MKRTILIIAAIATLIFLVACEQQNVQVTQQSTQEIPAQELTETPATTQPVVEDEYTNLQTAQDSFNALDEALDLYE
tara:strand:- start:1104 stop:1334 length:231 start_codon:yes stop_codon:yes gene_type:complete